MPHAPRLLDRRRYLETMQPVVILDSNALHGSNPFARTPIMTLLELSRLRRIQLVVPEVVLHEIARQSMEVMEDSAGQIRASLKKFNAASADAGAGGVAIDLPARMRMDFYDHARAILDRKNVEIPPPPAIPVEDLLRRDLDVKKPFARDGRGFRDALIWETVRVVCDALGDRSTPVILVTNNRSDFYSEKGGQLHPHLRADLATDLRFDVVGSPHHAQSHDVIGPLMGSMRALTDTLKHERLVQLVDSAIADLDRDLQNFSVYVGEGMYESPISTALDDAAFDEVIPDNDSITHEIYHTGDGQYSIQVTVEAEASLTGFVDKSDYYISDDDGVTVLEDWNRHVFRASEPHRRLLFTLRTSFSEAELDRIHLAVEEVEEVR